MAAPQDPANQEAMLAAWMDLMLVISQKQLQLSMLILPDRRSGSSDGPYRSLGGEHHDDGIPLGGERDDDGIPLMDPISQRRAELARIKELNAELAALFLRVNALKLKWAMRGNPV